MMPRLILLRHAKTESDSPTGLDRDRPLASRGWTDAPVVAAALMKAGYRPDRILLSPARRAQETWSAIAPLFSDCLPEVADDLYLADLATLSDYIEMAAQFAGTILLIGHNPGLHQAVDNLCHGEGIDSFPTSAAAVFSHSAGGWMLDAYFTPKSLRSHPDAD